MEEKKAKKPVWKRWYMIVLYVFVGIMIFGNFMSTHAPPTTPTITQTPTEKVYGIGDTLTLNQIAYTVNSVDTYEALGSDYMVKEPSGIFYVVSLTVENLDTKSKDYFNPTLTLIDSQGREFSEDREASVYLKLMGFDYFMLTQLQPDLPKEGSAVFDVPTTATGLKLKIKETAISLKTATVKLS